MDDVLLLKKKIVISAGWGRLSAGGRLPKTLQKINLRSLSYKTCSDIYNNSDVDIGHICTLTKAGEGACNVKQSLLNVVTKCI